MDPRLSENAMPRSQPALSYCEIKTRDHARTLSSPPLAAESDNAFSVGTEVAGRYVVRYEIGKGGMGPPKRR